VREHLWEYLKREAAVEKPVEVFGELEMLQLLEQFFDKALYWAAIGYENQAHPVEGKPGAAKERPAQLEEIGHVVGR
jgi:hypothetical protein